MWVCLTIEIDEDGEKEIADVLADADMVEPWKVVGAIENIPLDEEEAHQLAD